MAKIIIKFKASVRGEVVLRKDSTSIGRTSTNDITIENLAVSRCHAEIIQEEGVFSLLDLQSSNGTFVNGVRTKQTRLHDGDVILIGKHTLLFVNDNSLADIIASAPKSHQDPDAFLRSTMEWEIKPSRESEATIMGIPPAQKMGTPGVLQVHQGKLARGRYLLSGEATIIGAAEYAEIRLTAANAPPLAAIIHRTARGYSITPSEIGIRLNNRKLIKRQALETGDFISIQAVVFSFHLDG